MNYNEVIKEIKRKVENGEPIHGWMREMWIDYCMDNLDNLMEENKDVLQRLKEN